MTPHLSHFIFHAIPRAASYAPAHVTSHVMGAAHKLPRLTPHLAYKRLGLTTVLLAAMMSAAHAAPIYKVVDEQTGQVTFTDRPQNYDNQNVSVSQMQVMTAPAPSTSTPATMPSASSTPSNLSANNALANNLGSQTLNRNANPTASEDIQLSDEEDELEMSEAPEAINYRIQLLEPSEERAYRKPAQTIDVEIQTTPNLQNGDSVVIAIDGYPVAEGTSVSIPTDDIPPGEHTLTATVMSQALNIDDPTQLQNQEATSVSQTFYIIQNTVMLQNKRKAAELKAAYNALPWYKKLYLKMRGVDSLTLAE